MTYRKIGGIHFVRLGRFGFSFYWSQRREPTAQEVQRALRRFNRRNVSALDRAWLATTEWCNRSAF